jgi:hypothetical protein
VDPPTRTSSRKVDVDDCGSVLTLSYVELSVVMSAAVELDVNFRTVTSSVRKIDFDMCLFVFCRSEEERSQSRRNKRSMLPCQQTKKARTSRSPLRIASCGACLRHGTISQWL